MDNNGEKNDGTKALKKLTSLGREDRRAFLSRLTMAIALDPAAASVLSTRIPRVFAPLAQPRRAQKKNG